LENYEVVRKIGISASPHTIPDRIFMGTVQDVENIQKSSRGSMLQIIRNASSRF